MSSDKPVPAFTMRELLSQMAELDPDIEPGEKLTTEEFKDALGLGSPDAARKRIKPLVRGKVLTPVRKKIVNMAGIETTVPAYCLTPGTSLVAAMRALGREWDG